MKIVNLLVVIKAVVIIEVIVIINYALGVIIVAVKAVVLSLMIIVVCIIRPYLVLVGIRQNDWIMVMRL